ncbi:Uncharacterised protein [Moraxella lacunata]|uniref:Uncharacterized protein n=1 Tax=Moraxella lacunata TaxID=477 RepID=A0A378TU03_MORLA|nr:hypothetical protein [Moraxella lacunata]STZ64335.1 Uncharacterised protein [Moraxella lacunata]
MTPKSYPLRPKQAKALFWNFPKTVSKPVIFFITPIIIIFFPQITKYNYFLVTGVLLIISLMIDFIVAYFFKDKINGIRLIIDETGIYTNSKYLSKILHFKPIHWHDIQAVSYCHDKSKIVTDAIFSNKPAELEKYPNFLLIHGHSNGVVGALTKRFAIHEHIWQIDDFDEVIAIFKQKGFDIQNFNDDSYAKAFLSEQHDLGKRSGHLAYSSFGLFIALGVLFYFDKFITLDFGNMDNIYMGVAIAVFVLGGYYTYSENKRLDGTVSLIIFVPMATLFLFSIMLFISPMVGKKYDVDFDFKGGKWQTDYKQKPLYIECQKHQTNIKSDGKLTITDTLGMVRVSFDELDKVCIGGRFSKG